MSPAPGDAAVGCGEDSDASTGGSTDQNEVMCWIFDSLRIHWGRFGEDSQLALIFFKWVETTSLMMMMMMMMVVVMVVVMVNDDDYYLIHLPTWSLTARFPLKSYWNPKGKDRLPTIIFQGPASGFLKNEDFTVLFQEKSVFFLQDFKPMGPRILFLKRIPSFEKPINLKDYQKTCQPHPRWCREKNGPVPGRWHQEWRQFSGGNRCLKNLVGKGI